MSKQLIPMPHDKAFKQALSDVRMKDGNSYDNYVSGMLKYALDQGEVQDVELFLLGLHRALPKSIEEKIMTITEQLIQKGMRQGMQQGVQQGELAVLTRLMKFRFGNIPPFYQEKMQKADEASLLLWSENLLGANSLEEIFD